MKELLYNYCEDFSQNQSLLLSQLIRDTHLKTTSPRMLSGKLQGRFLSFLSKMVRPKCVLEIGTFTGFSALCLAEGLAPNGELITLEVNEEMKKIAEVYFKRSDYKEQIDMRIGNALDIIPQLDKRFDLVFIDAKKTDYPAYFDLIIEKMNMGGLIISDNVLWSGKVLDLEKNNDEKTKALHEYNLKLLNDPRVDNIILPIRDGLHIVMVNG